MSASTYAGGALACAVHRNGTLQWRPTCCPGLLCTAPPSPSLQAGEGSLVCAAPLHCTEETLAQRWFNLLSPADTPVQVEDDSALEDLVVQETGRMDESGEMRRPWCAHHAPSVT